MARSIRLPVMIAAVLALAATAIPASAGHSSDPRTNNVHPMGHIEEPASLLNPNVGNPDIHTDIAFWGDHAFQGNWDGFNIRDISSPGNPTQVSRTFCNGNQGDVVVWDNILVRSWNSPTGSGGSTCDGETVNPGFEGLHVFDISDLSDPVLVADVNLSAAPGADAFGCGSHTATGVPDLANDRLLIYNGSSSGSCPWIDIVEVPLSNPSAPSVVAQMGAGRQCHDIGVILGDANLAGCAGGDGFSVLSMDPADGGSLTTPVLLHSTTVPGVSIGHSAAFTWDGETLIFGHEPGGGVQANCQESNPDSDKSFFFYEARTGAFEGMWTLTRDQSANENCSLHNYNVVPLRSKKGADRDVLVHGSYQSGTAVLDFADRTAAMELGYSDPDPLPIPPSGGTCPAGCELGGAWSSYWYNGFIYETNITEGLNVFRFSGSETAGALKLGHLNPQTQEFTL